MACDKVRLLLDTDIGSDIDDAVALAYLLSQPRCELVGITTVTGEPAKRAELASAICTHVGRGDIPIWPGAAEAMLIATPQRDVPQGRALGDWPRRTQFAPGEGVEFMRRTIRANPGELTLLGIGPLTNIATLFAVDPEIPALLKQLVLMCGRFFGQTGRTPEWNAKCDPHATAIVYGAGDQRPAGRHVSFGLDVTAQCRLAADECRRRFTAKVLEPVRDFADVFFEKFENNDAITFHDPLAAACIFAPDICQYRHGEVSVSLAETDAGATSFIEMQDDDAHTVAEQVDPQAFFDHYFDVVGS